MQSTSGWWRRNVWTLAILLGAFFAAFAVRTIWTYPIIEQWGSLYTYAGGSDSYYHSRVMSYIILTHTNLIHDPMLKFPFGEINPREPLFDWMNAVLGILFAPFFGGSAVNAGAWFLNFQGPFWAALSVFPVYLIGKEVSSRRMGLIAAMIFPFLPASIDSSIFGYANYLSFYTFVILIVVYSWIRTVKAVGTRRYVSSYRQPKQIYQGVRSFFTYERTAVKWAVFTGVSLGALALAWQGYTYAVVVIALSVLVLLIAERIRHVDSFGLYLSAWIIGPIGFLMAMPYYLVQQQFAVWFDLPLLLYFGTLLLLLPFVLMRDVPWVVSIPSLVGLVLVAAAFLAVVSPSDFNSIITGQGYFVKNLIYSTVAEDQAPSFDELVVGYGVVTFFVAFVGLILVLVRIGRERFPRAIVAFAVFAMLSVFLPISAAKFFLLASPAFALLPAEALKRALDVAGFPELRRTVASLSDSRSKLGAFRRAFKLRHVLIMVLIVGLVLPNIWISIDAGIPGNTKSQLGAQVGASIPSWLQPTSGPASSVFFGAAGTTLDTPDQYDSAGYNWLSTQDTALPAPNRPAVISWWDYGFQTIAQGQHPSVADNFQNGIDPAGQFLLAQNESLAIGVMATTLLQAEQTKSGDVYLPPSLNTILAADGLNLGQLHTLLVNETADLALVINHPTKYLPVDPTTLTADNAMYLAVSYYIADALPIAGVSQVYNQIQAYTGWTIGYDLADSRLIPFSGQDTGIFYAPADLTGRVINGAGLPSSFFNVTEVTTSGDYPLGTAPATASVINYTINYFTPFYSSMIYRTYFGYNGTDIGDSGGIPGLSSNLASSPVEPGWMLEHFQVVYRTAYYCPTTSDDRNNSNCLAENLPSAVKMANATAGAVANTSDFRYFSGGEAFLQYYPGENLLGDVALPDGTPVPGVDATVFDQWGIPHETAITAADGSYQLVLPPGNDTVNITTGTFQGLSQQGGILLKSIKIYVPPALGLDLQSPNLVQSTTIGSSSVNGVVYWNLANNSTFVPTKDKVVPGAQVVLWGPYDLRKVTTSTDAGGTFDLTGLAPGVYNYSVVYDGHNYSQSDVYVSANSQQNASAGLTGGSITGVVSENGAVANNTLVVLSNGNGTIGTNITNATGAFAFVGLGPGNYTATAYTTSAALRSTGVRVEVIAPGTTATVHLVISPVGPLQVVVEVNGGGIAGIPVRFTPLPAYTNASAPPIGELVSQSANGTTVVSGPNGLASATLPAGQYSVYALGYVGSSLEAALTSAAVIPGVSQGPIALPLQPAAVLSGQVAYEGPQGNGTKTALLVYATGESETTAWTTSGNRYSMVLPVGTYTVLALEGSTTSTTGLYAAIGNATVRYATTLSLTPSTAVVSRFTVGSLLPSGALFPAPAATVSVSAGLGGPTVNSVADANGTVTFLLPSTLPLSAGSYCVNAGSAGFSSASSCQYAPASLSALTQFPLTLSPVPVTLRVLGLPSGTPVTINLSATSASAMTRNLTGGPYFSFSTTPGSYTLSARAVIGNGTVVYIPSSLLNTTIALGATSTALTLLVVPAVNATGTLVLPSGGSIGNATVALSSPTLNVTANGTAFTSSGVRIAPGTYSAHTTVTIAGVVYNNLTTVIVSPSGVISPSIAVRTSAVTLTGSLETATNLSVPVNTTVTLRAPSGATLVENAVGGTFAASVPANTTFRASANVTVLVAGTNGSYYETYASVAGATCTTGNSSAVCVVRVNGLPLPAWLNGTLSAAGQPGYLAGTVRLAGPYPSSNLTVLTTSNGTFSALLPPGAYSVYATAGGGSEPFAALGQGLALPGASTVALVLNPTWGVTVRVTGPNGTAGGLGPATLVLRDATGHQLVYNNLTLGTPVTVALPIGKYTAQATATGSPYGVTASAYNSTSFTVASGNLAVSVGLAYQWFQSVTAALVGVSSATVAATGGSATFQISVRDTGNLPVTVHGVGSPAYWNFTFSQGNVTLYPAPGGSAVTEEVTVYVPAGTVVAHPNIVLSMETGSDVVEGTVLPPPTITVLPSYGILAGPSTSLTPKIQTNATLIPFYVLNTGNTYETLNISIVSSLRLEALGWHSVIELASIAPLVTPPLQSAGSNATYWVNLTAIGRIFLPPGSVTISIGVLNSSGAVTTTIVLSAAIVTVATSTSHGPNTLTVTGPGIGAPPSALPTWVIPVLVFVPALALAIGLTTWRWWRTRRWVRR